MLQKYAMTILRDHNLNHTVKPATGGLIQESAGRKKVAKSNMKM